MDHLIVGIDFFRWVGPGMLRQTQLLRVSDALKCVEIRLKCKIKMFHTNQNEFK